MHSKGGGSLKVIERRGRDVGKAQRLGGGEMPMASEEGLEPWPRPAALSGKGACATQQEATGEEAGDTFYANQPRAPGRGTNWGSDLGTRGANLAQKSSVEQRPHYQNHGLGWL